MKSASMTHMPDVPEFVNDAHAFLTGAVFGTLVGAGVPCYVATDDGGYTPVIRISINQGGELVEVDLEVKWS